MAQFDSLIILPLLWSLIFFLFLYYNMTMTVLIPDFFGIKKFREKKLNLYKFYKFFNESSEIKTSSSVIVTL